MLNLKIADLFILNCIHNNEILLLDTAIKYDGVVSVRVNSLIKSKVINKIGSSYGINSKYVEAVFRDKPIENINNIVQSYRDLFPKGSNNNGYPYKGDRQGCVKKMKKFIKNNPEYSLDIILKATKKYINEARKDNYNYMQLAHYFIEKNGVSGLGAFCEQIVNGESGSDFNNIINF